MESNPGDTELKSGALDGFPLNPAPVRSAIERASPLDTAEQLNEQWTRVRSRLQQDVGDVEYRTWLRQMALGNVDGDAVTVHLPSRFLRDWVRGHYADKLNALRHSENKRIRRVDIRVGGTGVLAEPSGAERDGSALPDDAFADAPGLLAPDLLAPDLLASDRADDPRSDPARPEMAAPLDTRFEFDSFVVGKPNEFAYACARRVAERTSPMMG